MKAEVSTSSSIDLTSPTQSSVMLANHGTGNRPVPHALMERIERAAPLFQRRASPTEYRYPGFVRLGLLIGAPLLLWAILFGLVGLLIAPN